MIEKKIDLKKMLINEWRELGFYYDFDERLSVYQWRFYGSKSGLKNFVKILNDYTINAANDRVSEHDHLGPYSYLKIITLDNQAVINENAFGGAIADLKKLRNIIAEKLEVAQSGETFNIDKDYGEENTVTVKFFIMADNFDPVSMDELIISGRQEIVNRKHLK